MWALSNRTPYAAERNWIRDKQGATHWLVAVKATFDVAPDGRLKLADEQPPPLLAPEHRGDPAKTSLRLDSDLMAIKPGTDILVDACARAPKGRPAPMVPVSLRVGEIEKTLLVHGTRVYYRGTVGLTHHQSNSVHLPAHSLRVGVRRTGPTPPVGDVNRQDKDVEPLAAVNRAIKNIRLQRWLSTNLFSTDFRPDESANAWLARFD